VFTVGLLAAAWQQERGGTPHLSHLYQGFRTNLRALLVIGVFFVGGITLAVSASMLVDDGRLLEWAEIHGGLHRSGTPAEPIRAATSAGYPVLIEVDLAGARAVKTAMPEALTVFLAPPSWEALESRLTGRGTETSEVMNRRLATARAELAAQHDFDRIVVNSQLESACAELVSLLVVPR